MDKGVEERNFKVSVNFPKKFENFQKFPTCLSAWPSLLTTLQKVFLYLAKMSAGAEDSSRNLVKFCSNGMDTSWVPHRISRRSSDVMLASASAGTTSNTPRRMAKISKLIVIDLCSINRQISKYFPKKNGEILAEI